MNEIDENNDNLQQVPELPVPYTVREAMTACGVDDNSQFEGKTPAERLSSDIFSDDFQAQVRVVNIFY